MSESSPTEAPFDLELHLAHWPTPVLLLDGDGALVASSAGALELGASPAELARWLGDNGQQLAGWLDCGERRYLEGRRRSWGESELIELLDLTERELQTGSHEQSAQAEQRLRGYRLQRELLERLFEAVPAALFVKDPRDSFRLNRINSGFERLFGVQREQIIGRTDYDLFDTDLADHYRRVDEETFGGGVPTEVEEQIQTSEGRRTVRTSKIPLFGPDGEPELLIGVIEDVSEYRDAVNRAEDANRAKSQFLANMSHEIRTPLNGVLGLFELARDVPQSGKIRELLQTAQGCAESLLELINDVLDLSKIEAAKLELTTAELSPEALIASVVETVASAAKTRSIRIEVELAELPARVLGDRTRLRQVLLNLMSNAIKFSRPDSTVHLRVAPADARTLRFEVEDFGIGIAPEHQELVFSAFSQADGSITRDFGGTGLGLAIASQLVGLMGGELELESEARVGSRFWFTADLPLTASPALPRGAAPTDPQPSTLRPLRVLIAEDNPINQRIARGILERGGHTVVLANDGVEALEALEAAGASHYDIALMDLAMPRLDGLSAMARIRAEEAASDAPRMPILAVTAHAMAEDRERSLAAGADEYLAKPFSAAALEAALRRALGIDAAA